MLGTRSRYPAAPSRAGELFIEDICETVSSDDKNCWECCPIVRRNEHKATMMVQGDLAHQPWMAQMALVILDQLDDPAVHKLIVDMSGVTDFGIQSVAWWLGLERFVRDRARTLVVVNASPVVHGVLQRMAIREGAVRP